jgi:hypothetical protein
MIPQSNIPPSKGARIRWLATGTVVGVLAGAVAENDALVLFTPYAVCAGT